LAIYLKQQGNIPEMEYYCSDTGCKLPETFELIDKLDVKDLNHDYEIIFRQVEY